MGESNVVPIQQFAAGPDEPRVGTPQVEDRILTDVWGDFWTLYPRHEAKKDARKAWDQLSATEQIQAIIAIADWRRVWQDQNREMQHIKLAGPWLRGERWEDEVPKEYVRREPAKGNGEDKSHPPKALEIPQYVKDQIAKLRGKL